MKQNLLTPNNPHLIIQGKSRTGKTELANQLAKETGYEIEWVEAKRVHKISSEYEMPFRERLYDIEHSIKLRLDVLKEEGAANYSDNRVLNKIKPKILILDDLDYHLLSLYNLDMETAQNKLYSIFRIGPSVGIFCIITTQIQLWDLLPKYKSLIHTTISTAPDSDYVVNQY